MVTDDNGSPGNSADDFTADAVTVLFLGNTYNIGDTDHDNVLDLNESWVFSETGVAGEAPYSNIGTVEGSHNGGPEVSDTDSSSYIGSFKPDFIGLSAGFWSQHLNAWDANLATTNKGNLVGSGVLCNNDVLCALPTHGIVPTGPGGVTGKGVLLGDADASGTTNGGEATLSMSLAIAQTLVTAKLSDKTDARLNLLQQAVAAQLNVDNHADDPGKISKSGGGDLLGTAVKWLTAHLPLANGNAAPSAWSIDVSPVGGDGILAATEIVLGAKLGFPTTIKTSSPDWLGDFLIDTSNSHFGGAAVYASGQDLKNALEAFDTGKLITSADGNWVGWNNGGVISDAQANDQDGLWKVLIDDLHIGHHA